MSVRPGIASGLVSHGHLTEDRDWPCEMRSVLPTPCRDYVLDAASPDRVYLHINPWTVRDILPELICSTLETDPETWFVEHAGTDEYGWDIWMLERDNELVTGPSEGLA